ncbi:hypothetical protein N7540_003608 [Penicillium herquei]|nr:hypothetical protein N7540_003608 [Penicillium herquei]
MVQQNQVDSDLVYHVILRTSEFKVLGEQNGQVRILGTYTSIGKAKEAAHRSLFESGYEREWFSIFETDPEVLEKLSVSRGPGLAVYAVATDGTAFQVRIATSLNTLHLTTDNEDGRITIPLFYVVQTNIPYCTHERKPEIDINVEGIFKNYAEARKFASSLLLSEEDGIIASSYQDYCEAGPNEKDCEYGNNVIVHAIGGNGENYFISVVKCQELESVRLADASSRIP